MTAKHAPAKARSIAPRRAGDFAHPYAMVDVVVFTARANALEVLLVRRPDGAAEPFPGLWSLPGGFVDVKLDRDLLGCARRKLLEKTGVASPYLEQLGSWGSATRDPRGWSATHAYFALVHPHDGFLSTRAESAGDLGLFEVDALLRRPRLAFDHGEILRAAVERLRSKAEYTSLPAFLLPEPFTLPQLQRAWEVVLGRAVDKSAFRTRMLAAAYLTELGIVDGGATRPPMGYRLSDRSAPVVFPRTFSPREKG